jgi:hypothetical protein
LMGAVAEEVEWQLERRVKEFVGGATSEALRTIARHICNPDHAESYGHLRVAALDVILDAPIKDLISEADKMKPEEMVDVVVAALKSAVSEDDFVDRTADRVETILDEAGDGTLGAWLDEVGLTDVWSETTTEFVTARLQAVVDTEGFEQWWIELFAPAEIP